MIRWEKIMEGNSNGLCDVCCENTQPYIITMNQ